MSHHRPYPAYKESRIEWLGKVPEHWNILSMKRMATIRNGQDYKSIEAAGGPYPVIGSGGEFARASAYIYEGESVLLGRKGTIDKPLYINGRFWTVDTMFFTEIAPRTHAKYLYYVATTIPFGFYSTNTALPSMTQESLSGHLLAAPNIGEQKQIASVLDYETGRIDALITKKNRFIELLKEKRQALITQAVTKGLNPKVKMKSSGVEWIGDVPEHWVVAQLGKIAEARCDGPFGSGLKSEHYKPEGVRVVRLQNIGWASFKGDDSVYISHDHWRDVLRCGHDVLPDDLIIAGLGDDKNPLGRACVAPFALGTAIVKADCYRFRLNKALVLPEFIALALSATARGECGYLATGATRDRLNLGLASARVVPIPPRDEQVRIVENLAVNIGRIDLLTQKSQLSIDLLKEHRSALITAAVTGKIDLRESI
jgi:type I restriction enzyme, S subunit